MTDHKQARIKAVKRVLVSWYSDHISVPGYVLKNDLPGDIFCYECGKKLDNNNNYQWNVCGYAHEKCRQQSKLLLRLRTVDKILHFIYRFV